MAVAAPTAYCQVPDLTTLGVTAVALAGVSSDILQAAVDGANAEADSYLGNIYTLPLLQWGRDLQKFCVSVAVYDIFVVRGFDPGSPDLAEQIRDRATDARKWFGLVAAGKASPSMVIDSSTTGGTSAAGGPGGAFVTQPRVQPSAGGFVVTAGPVKLRGW